jgi:hypothetical protein
MTTRIKPNRFGQNRAIQTSTARLLPRSQKRCGARPGNVERIKKKKEVLD